MVNRCAVSSMSPVAFYSWIMVKLIHKASIPLTLRACIFLDHYIVNYYNKYSLQSFFFNNSSFINDFLLIFYFTCVFSIWIISRKKGYMITSLKIIAVQRLIWGNTFLEFLKRISVSVKQDFSICFRIVKDNTLENGTKLEKTLNLKNRWYALLKGVIIIQKKIEF